MTEAGHPGESEQLTLHELAGLVGIRRQFIERMVRLELIRPVRRDPEVVFTPAVVPRVRKVIRLHYQLEVSWSTMELVLQLLDRIEEMERRLGEYRDSGGSH
jgi:hypothetical protein